MSNKKIETIKLEIGDVLIGSESGSTFRVITRDQSGVFLEHDIYQTDGRIEALLHDKKLKLQIRN